MPAEITESSKISPSNAHNESPQGNTLVGRFDAVLADLDGVVYAGPNAIPGAIEALQGLAPAGISLAYVTNNASRTPAQVAAHLRDLGAPAADDQVVSSAQAGAALLASQFPAGSKVMVVGSAALAEEVRYFDMQIVPDALAKPDVVIQGFEPTLGWANLAEAAFAINGGAQWIATNTDMTIPRERGIAPGNGTLVAAVRAAVGREPQVAGKPEAPLFHTAAQRLGASNALVVGDRLDTDILGGNNAGMASCLVLTGVDSPTTAMQAKTSERPQFMIENLGDLFSEYPAIEEHDGVFRCGADSAWIEGGALAVGRAPGDESDLSLNAWRAMCAAWWAEVPETAVPTNPYIIFAGRFELNVPGSDD